VGGQAFELFVKVGRIRLELESKKFFPGLEAACKRALPNLSCSIKRGKFFRTRQTITDYAKYGRVEDTRILGLIDPKAKKDRMAILSEVGVTIEDIKEE
jgi:methyl-coenzyme M reductase subunit D